MFSDLFLNPKIYNKEERKEKIKSLSIDNVIFKNGFSGFNYSLLKKVQLFEEKNKKYFINYINDIKVPIYEVLPYNAPTKFYLDCEMEDIPQNIYIKKEELFMKFNNYLLNFLNKKYPGKEKEILYADSSRLKNDNYKISIHVIVNKLGYFQRNFLKKLVLEFSETLPQDDFFKNGKNFVDNGVYRGSQLMRIIFSHNLSNDSILKPFIISDNKLIYKNVEYISNNYEKSLCGNYYKYSYNEIIENIEQIVKPTEKRKYSELFNDKIPEWKINWIKNNIYVKNIYKIDTIEKNKVNLLRTNFNTYCRLCGRNHERENAMCKVYKNNIMFYCNRNNKGISIGSWYDNNEKKDDNILEKIKIENKLLKEKIKELENEIILLKSQKESKIDYNIDINSKWYKYYDCGKLIKNNEIDSFKNIIGQIWKDGNVSKIKNRCLRIYKLIEYMKINNIKKIKTTIRTIFHLPNWEFDEHLKDNSFF